MTTWERKKARMKAREDEAERIRSRAGLTRMQKVLNTLALAECAKVRKEKLLYRKLRREGISRNEALAAVRAA